MSVRPFDTHDYVQALIKGGFSQQLAETNMQALVKALDFTIENHVFAKLEKFATREQLQATNEQLQTTKHELQREIQQLDHKIDKVFLKTVVSMGSMITIGCTVLGILIKF